MISSPENFDNWFRVEVDKRETNKLAMVTGVVLDVSYREKARLDGMDSRIFYIHPGAEPSSSGLIIHQHAVIFDVDGVEAEGKTRHSLASEIVSKYKVISVKHVLDHSLFDVPCYTLCEYDGIRERGEC